MKPSTETGSNTAASGQMKQVQERHLSVSVTKCVWSPKMDLLLTANNHGHVTLQRHRSLQRVWQLVPPADQCAVTGLAWRPDSNLAAVGYSTGAVLLVTLETGTTVHSLQVEGAVTSLAWQQHPLVAQEPGEKELWADYVTPLPASDKWFTDTSNAEASGGDKLSWQDNYILDNQNSLSLLIVGTSRGQVLLYAFGLVHLATIDLSSRIDGIQKVLDAQCSHDMNMLSVVVESTCELTCLEEGKPKRAITHLACDLILIAEHHRELFMLTRKYAEIQSLFDYSTRAIAQLREAWEGILLEMDTKLAAYGAPMLPGAVSADLMELHVFGRFSPDLTFFLTNNLTENGLKKLRQNVELGYTNVHKLVVKQLEAVGQGLVFTINQVLGMSRRRDTFGRLGVDETIVNKSLKESGAFLLKTGELQEVIGLSMRNFLAFLKWLSAVQLHVSGSTVPAELAESTKEEGVHVFRFLDDTLEDIVTDKDGKQHRQFRLEGVGQYLKDENLKAPQSTKNNVMVQLLEQIPELANHPMILPQRRNTSLIQEYDILTEELVRMPMNTVQVLSGNIRVSTGVTIFKTYEESEISITQRSNSTGEKLNLIIVPGLKSDLFYFCQLNTCIDETFLYVKDPAKSNTLMVSPFTFSASHNLSVCSLAPPRKPTSEDAPVTESTVIAAHFYDTSTASVLIRDFNSASRSLFIQVPVNIMEESLARVTVPERCTLADADLASVDLSRHVPQGNVRRLDVAAGLFGVSGERKLAVVLAMHRRTMLLYEMEVDDDEEEDEEEEVAEDADRSNM